MFHMEQGHQRSEMYFQEKFQFFHIHLVANDYNMLASMDKMSRIVSGSYHHTEKIFRYSCNTPSIRFGKSEILIVEFFFWKSSAHPTIILKVCHEFALSFTCG